MIVFTIKNSRNNTVYIGTTKKSIDECWTMYQLAKDAAIDAPLYNDMRQYGVACFSIEEYDFAESREELVELYEEAMQEFNGISLKGMKTALPRTAVYTLKEDTESATPIIKRDASESNSQTIASANNRLISKASKGTRLGAKAAPEEPVVKLKLATGRTGSAIKEKRIKEAIEQEKAARDALKRKQIAEQADEMKAILSALDSRGSTLGKRY
ncbi:GIY-YIG nuclease family protein [Gammaproteobacteria bacterium AS21]